MTKVLIAFSFMSAIASLASADVKSASTDDIQASNPVDNPDDFVPVGDGGGDDNNFCSIYRDGDPHPFCCIVNGPTTCCSRGGLEWHCDFTGGMPINQP